MGTNPRKYHHPDKSRSCKRRTLTASVGKMSDKSIMEKIKMNNHVRNPKFENNQIPRPKTIAVTDCTMRVNKTHHQYSDRPARPSKSPYLFQHVVTASFNPIISP